MRPQRQLARQIEPPTRYSRQRRRNTGLFERAHLKPRPRRRSLHDQLPRHSHPLRKQRPQALVPPGQIAQRCLQRRAVERTAEPHRQRDHIGPAATAAAVALASMGRAVMMPASIALSIALSIAFLALAILTPLWQPGRAGLQPLQEPQPPLRIGQRDLRRTQHRHKPRTHRLPSRQKPQAQRRHTRRLEQAADRNLDPQHRPHPADQPRRQQRVAAKLEEVVVDADPRNPQHLGKQPAQDLLLRRARRPVRVLRRQAPAKASARRSSLPFGVSGSRSSTTSADGTMYSGSTCDSAARSPTASTAAKAPPSAAAAATT